MLVDAYRDPLGGARNFLEALRHRPTLVVRPAHHPMAVDPAAVSAVVISGSAASVAVDPPDWMSGFLSNLEALLDAGLPTLGVCFGHQAIAHILAGPSSVRLSPTPEIGWYDIEITQRDPILEGFDSPFRTFLSHVDDVVPHDAFETLARTPTCDVQAFRVPERPIWGVQFHAEMDLDEATDLVRSRAKKSPERNIDPEDVLSRAVDSKPLLNRLMQNFLNEAGLDS